MVPNYSKILINDLVVTQQKEGLFMTRSDMNMLAMLGSMERSEKQWHELVKKAGLVIVKIWTKEARYESVIEVELRAEPSQRLDNKGSISEKDKSVD